MLDKQARFFAGTVIAARRFGAVLGVKFQF
jgi:hypothetical protein